MAEEPREEQQNPADSPPNPGEASKPASSPEPVAVSSVAEAVGLPEAALDANIDLLLDVSLNVSVEVGRTRLPVEDILRLSTGSIVRLNRGANEPVELRVNGKLVAYGEVVVVNECYAIRLVQIVDAGQRVAASGKG